MFKLPAVLALVLLVAGPAAAQPKPVDGFDPTATAVNEDALLKGLKPITGRITIPDAKAATLIQPAGPDWRDYHRSWVPVLAAVFVLGTLAALALFFMLRGRIRVQGGFSGITIPRFSAFERFMHWLTAMSWLVLAVSGLNVAVGRRVLLPLMSASAYSTFSEWAKFAHNFVAFPFAAGVVLMFLVWVRGNLPTRIDVEWFKQGGGMIGNRHPSAEKFNGGQKVVFWVVVGFGGLISVSGFVLLFPFFGTNIWQMQIAQMVHGILALMMMAAMLAHIYIGTVGMEGAFDAMGKGSVDLKWAKEHHDLWVAQEQARTGKVAAE
jgi:formate dehydrogenase subunit gamma